MNNKILKNWSILTASNLAGQILGMFATIIVARSLIPAEYGYYSLIMIYADMGLIIAGLGMRQILIREVSRNPEFARQYLKKIALIQFLVSIPVVVFIIVRFQFTHEDLHTASAASVVLMYSLLMWQLFNGIAFSHENFTMPALINLAERMVWLLVLWLLPKQWLNLTNIAFIFVSIQLAGSFLLMYLVYSKNYLAPVVKKSSVNLIKMAAPLYWVELLVIITDQLPILFLSSNSPSEEVGFFYASLKLILPVEMMIMTLLLVIMPSLSKAHGDSLLFNRLVKNSIMAIIIIGIAVASVTTILSTEIIYIIFGERYEATVMVLSYQVWFAIIVALLDFMGTALIASNNQKKLGIISTIAAFVYVPIMWYSSYYGAIGLAIGFLTVGVINVIYWWPIFQKLHGYPISFKTTLILLSAIASSFIFANMVSNTNNLWLKIPVVVLLSCSLVYYLYKVYMNKKKEIM